MSFAEELIMKKKTIRIKDLPKDTGFKRHNENGELELFILEDIEMEKGDQNREIIFTISEMQDPDFGDFYTCYTGEIDGFTVSVLEKL